MTKKAEKERLKYEASMDGYWFTVLSVKNVSGKIQYVLQREDGLIIQFFISPSREHEVFPQEAHEGDIVSFTFTSGRYHCHILQAAGRPLTDENIVAIQTLERYLGSSTADASGSNKSEAEKALGVLSAYTGYEYYRFKEARSRDSGVIVFHPVSELLS